MITYYLREGKKEASGKKSKDSAEQSQEEEQDSTDTKKTTRDSVFLKIYDGERLIRTLKYKTPDSAGLHRVYWGLDEAGPDRPSRNIRKRNREPGGTNVKPGTYRAVIHLGEQTDETTIEVAPDPRLERNPAAMEAAYNASKKLEGFTQTAADAVKQLVESKSIAQKFQKDLKEKDKEQYKEQIKASGEIVKQIDSLIADYLGVEDKRQGITRNPEMTVLTRIRNASRYASSRPAGLTATENALMAYAEKDLKSALSKTNAFFAGAWKEYRDKMQALDLSPFKETETFNLN